MKIPPITHREDFDEIFIGLTTAPGNVFLSRYKDSPEWLVEIVITDTTEIPSIDDLIEELRDAANLVRRLNSRLEAV